MKISLVSMHTSPSEIPGQGDAGGMNIVVREAAHSLHWLGHDVTVFTRASDRIDRGSHELAPGIPLIALSAGDPQLSKGELPAVSSEFSRALQADSRFVASDVVHAHYWLSGVAAAEPARAIGAPHFVTMHTVATQKNAHLANADDAEPEVRLNGEAFLAREAVIIAGSASELAGITRGYGPPPLGAHIVHPGVDAQLFHPGSTRSGSVSTGRFTVTVLGRVQPHKGQDLALEAFALFCAQDPTRAASSELIIAGEATPDASAFAHALRERAEQLGLPVRFMPALSRAKAAALLRDSSLVLIPSHSETFGLVALEAAASGTPVVASRTTGLIEAVHEGVSGVLIPGRDPRDWANAIARFADDPHLTTRMSQSARTTALNHDWSSHARHLTDVYARYPTFG